MISGLSTAVSALGAFAEKMSVIADNVANVESEGFNKGRAAIRQEESGGVKCETVRTVTPGRIVVEGTGQGMERKEMANVNLEEEIPCALLTETMFAANAKIVITEEEMIGSVLDILG